MANFNPNAPIRAQLQTTNYDLQSSFITQYNIGVQHGLPGDWDVFVVREVDRRFERHQLAAISSRRT